MIQAALAQFSSQIEVTSSGSGEAAAHLEQAKGALGSMPQLSFPESAPDTSEITSAAADLQAQMQILLPYYQILSDRLKTASAGLTGAIDALDSASGQLAEGSAQLSGYSSALTEAADELESGIGGLQDGFREFREEGIAELKELAGEKLADVLLRIRALKKAEAEANTFSGLPLGKKGSVRFVFEAEELSAG